MMRTLIFFFLFLLPLVVLAQEELGRPKIKTIPIADTIQIDSVSINSVGFKVETLSGTTIDSSFYQVDFSKSQLILDEIIRNENDSIRLHYVNYPKFLTRKYTQFDRNLIVDDTKNLNKLYQLGENRQNRNFTPFSGLNTSGSISRGITSGNNQNTVLDSELDLQISGEISSGVHLRASIQDSNIPIQQGGYSQNLDEFDQVFIELYGENWNIRAGDVELVQDESYFASFVKQVQGLSLGGTLDPSGNPTQLFAAGAIVKGVFASSEFQGQEGNQGPYKLVGPNGELFVLIVAGSERVFVNGVRLERGENNDYVIDYNAGEIIFNATYPITSEMRITVEYQYSDQNYSRIVATGGGSYTSEKFQIGGFVYSENDLKNQPLQQNLSEEQVAILQNAGDNTEEMIAPSSVPATFDENKVLYEKQLLNGETIFVYSTDPEGELFQVRFSLVGDNQGNYVLSNASAITRVFEYIAPINGVPQGNYAPISQLFAPTKLQMAVVHGNYQPSEKTTVQFEFAGSKNDLNLYSEQDDNNNDGFAGRLVARQTLVKKNNWKLDGFATLNYVQDAFESVERIYDVEFNRDWNLLNPFGNQLFLDTGLEFFDTEKGVAQYRFQQLDYSKNFSGSRHVLHANLNLDSLSVGIDGSFLKSNATTMDTDFLRFRTSAVYNLGQLWAGGKFAMEKNEQILNQTGELTGISQGFQSYETFAGIGDSTGVFVEIGYRHRVNDSLRYNNLQRVSQSNDYYLESQLLHSKNANLSLFANFRTLKNKEEAESQQSLNSRLLYNQFLFDRLVVLNTSFETKSGTLPQQEFTYVKVDAGQGQYTWIDYNENGVQELEEFEIAPFPDQATYVRIFLPNQVFIKTHQNKFSQIISVNFQQWNEEGDFKGFLSHFYNQTSYLIDRKIRREGDNFNINPFKDGGENELALNSNFRNTLYFNRGKQHFTTSYSFISSNTKNLLSTGLQENLLRSHQLDFTHKVQESWLFNLKNQLDRSESSSENFDNRNYQIEGFSVNPKVSYLLSDRTRFDVFYQYKKQQNQLGEREDLSQQKLGASFSFANVQKYSISGEFNYILNDFTGNPFSPVAYQMLQGLQPEKNYTWTVLAQKKLTEYLDLNLSYFGRKSEGAKTIHTGSVQLRAYF